MSRRVLTVFLAVVTLGALVMGYRLVRSDIAAEIYRERLRSLADSYDQLRRTYNDAVKKTAVTELIVREGRLSVAVRTVEGVRQVIDTPFDPSNEVFVDYIVLDGRLWIRRVFDSHTPPASGVVIDPVLERINWQAPGLAVGKAVYRRLDEGRWVVTVTGDGSLGLARQDEPDPASPLSPPPAIQDYPQVEAEADRQIDRISTLDVLQRFVSGGG